MSAEEVVKEAAEHLVEAKTMGSADGLYISKSGLVRCGILIAGLVAGAGFLGYKIAEKQQREKFEEELKDQIEEAKKFYGRLHKTDDRYSTPEVAAKNLIGDVKQTREQIKESLEDAVDALARYQGVPDDEDEVTVETKEVNIFMQEPVDENFDLHEEMTRRSPDKPYVVSKEEFFTNEPSHEQSTITYYQGDGTLADEADQEVPNIDLVMGEANTSRFGHGSGDPRVVYIRNERLHTDFEVLLSDGKYAHEVLGFEHADGGPRGRRQANRLPKFRVDDT